MIAKVVNRPPNRGNSTGAAAVGAAEATVAKSIRLLGALGRVSGYVGLAFVVYDIASNTWDWWNQEYDSGAAGVQSTTAGSWGLTAGDNVGLGVYGQSGYGYVLCGAASPWPGVKQWWLGYEPSWASVMSVGAIVTPQGSYDCQNVALQLLAAPTVSGGGLPATGASGRDDVLSSIDAVIGEITAGTFEASNGSGAGQTAGTQEMRDTLQAARDIISNGVALPSGGTTSVDPGASVGAMPGAVPSSGETTSGDSSAATAAAIGAVASAVAAAQAAIVAAVSAVESAVASIPGAISVAQSAVVSAVQSATVSISAAITASQAAVVAAVDAVTARLIGVESAVDAVEADLEEMKNTAASDSPAFTCTSCTRTESWGTLMQSWQASAAAAPIFGLIARLAWPGAGTVQRQWPVGSWRGHEMTINLDEGGIGTVITVVRFVVIGGAVIVAYMIIFA